jgi:2-polyprenyl-3-methyl-5-hydroxy-6-metoxy-1,4-benzoquinol methylase
MPENVTNCLLCGHEQHSHFETIEFRDEQVVNQICDHCGLVFQSPRMTASELDEFYAREYRQVYQGDEGPTDKDLRTQKGRAAAILKFMRASVPKVNRHLDVGCSAGILLQEIQGHYKSQTVGIEPGDSYRNYAQTQGIMVYSDISDLKAADEAPFDLVSMGHVLEHFADPVTYLTDLRSQVMSAVGWLLIEVPNLYAHDSFEIAHMTAFSEHTLTQTLQKAGFEILNLKAHGQPRSDYLPLYLTVIARVVGGGVSHQVEPEVNVAFKRKQGLLRRKIVQRLFPGKAWKQV